MKVKKICFTRVVEDGREAFRQARNGEHYQHGNSIIYANENTDNEYPIYTRTEEEVEVKVPKYQWAIAPLEGTVWETTEFYENEKEMLLDAISIAESSWRWRRLDFTRIEE